MRKAILDAANRVIDLRPIEDGDEGYIAAPSHVSIGCFYVPASGAFLPPPPPPAHVPTVEDVNAERDRRLVMPFMFQGKPYDRDPRSMDRITGAATLAGFAIGAGAGPGNLFWHGGTDPFAWIANDNTVTLMDAPTTFALGQAAAAVETRIVFAARAIKNLAVIPDDFAADYRWPMG